MKKAHQNKLWKHAEIEDPKQLQDHECIFHLLNRLLMEKEMQKITH